MSRDAALRHLRDALVLTNAAIAELVDSDATQAALDHAVRARLHLNRSIELARASGLSAEGVRRIVARHAEGSA